MNPAPSRDTPAGRAYNDLRNLARRDGRDPAELLTLYALECFLGRLAISDHADEFVLKGGALMAAFDVRRPTRDIDLAAVGIINDVAATEQRVGSIIACERDDGIVFDTDPVVGEAIRDRANYRGVRVKFVASLATARIHLHVDINFGDPILPAPINVELPLLLGGKLALRGYPDHMVLAEKIVTAIDLGQVNTRWRDFVDIAAITGARRLRYDDIRVAIEGVGAYRRVALRPLAETLTGMSGNVQPRWGAWRRKHRLDTTPEHFADLLAVCVDFADPVIDMTAEGSTWDPSARTWNR